MKDLICRLAVAFALAFAFACGGSDDNGGGGKPVVSVSIDPPTVDLFETGETFKLTAVLNPADADNKGVSWTSSDPSVASVVGLGLEANVTAGINGGQTTITVTTDDGQKAGTCLVTLNMGPVEGVTLSPKTLNVPEGFTGTLTATVTPAFASNKEVTWSSNNPAVSVEGTGTDHRTGVVTGLAMGITATITVTTVDGQFKDTASVTVTAPSDGPFVYVGGDFGLLMNGVPQSAYAGCYINRIIIDSGNLHVVGMDADGKPAYWKNGVKTVMSMTTGSTQGEAIGVFVDGSGKVYVTGYEVIAGGNTRGKLWIDGANQGVGAPAGTISYYFTSATISHGVNEEIYLGGHLEMPDIEGMCVYRYRSDEDRWGIWTADVFYMPGDYDWPQLVYALDADADGWVYIIVPELSLKLNLDLEEGNLASIWSGVGAYYAKFINGTLYGAGFRYSGTYPPCYTVDTAVTSLPWDEGNWEKQFGEAYDVTLGADGTIWSCGIECYDETTEPWTVAPIMWRGTTIEEVPAWSNGIDDGWCWTIAVR
jgi:hypothetical protein